MAATNQIGAGVAWMVAEATEGRYHVFRSEDAAIGSVRDEGGQVMIVAAWYRPEGYDDDDLSSGCALLPYRSGEARVTQYYTPEQTHQIPGEIRRLARTPGEIAEAEDAERARREAQDERVRDGDAAVAGLAQWLGGGICRVARPGTGQVGAIPATIAPEVIATSRGILQRHILPDGRSAWYHSGAGLAIGGAYWLLPPDLIAGLERAEDERFRAWEAAPAQGR